VIDNLLPGAGQVSDANRVRQKAIPYDPAEQFTAQLNFNDHARNGPLKQSSKGATVKANSDEQDLGGDQWTRRNAERSSYRIDGSCSPPAQLRQLSFRSAPKRKSDRRRDGKFPFDGLPAL
jgi:hypothetical protein